MSEDKIEKSFNVKLPARLTISNISGSVRVQPSEEDIIQVIAVKNPHTGDPQRTEIEITQDATGAVTASTRFPEGAWGWLLGSHPCDVDYTVKAPRQCSINVTSVSSFVMLEGFTGDCSVNSVSGDIKLVTLDGALRIHTVSGRIAGEKMTGTLDLDSVSGDQEFKGSILSSVHSNTISGRVNLNTSLAAGPYHFKSVSGNVRLTMPASTHCSCELHTISGKLTSAFPVTSQSLSRTNQTMDVQGGGVLVELNSVSGDLSLDSDGVISSTPVVEASRSSVDSKDILERISRGELSVDEGIAKLKS
jgi:DUF4097 and DUF4098 domain-containing protein YvlB